MRGTPVEEPVPTKIKFGSASGVCSFFLSLSIGSFVAFVIADRGMTTSLAVLAKEDQRRKSKWKQSTQFLPTLHLQLDFQLIN
jgi:hypothetical protein